MKLTWKRVRSVTARLLSGLGVIVITALIGGFVGSVFSPGFAYRALQRAANVFRPGPSVAHQIVSEYMQETSSASIWKEPPTMFPISAAYMEQHFDRFDPRLVHRYVHLQSETWVPQVIQASVVFAGHPIEVLGLLESDNVLSPPMPPDGRTEWVLQLQSITTPNQGLVYCRVTRPARYRPRLGSIMRIEGVVIGAGGIPLGNGGVSPGSYMACSAVAGPPPFLRRANAYILKHPNALPQLIKKKGWG